MKKFLSIILSISMVFCLSLIAFAAEPEVDSAPMTKAEFAEYCHAHRQTSTRSVAATADTMSADDAESLAAQYVTATSSQKTQIEEQLNASGFYIYSNGSEGQNMLQSQPSDVTLSGVVTVYDDNTGNWSLVAGGSWSNLDAISDDAGFWIWGVGSTKKIGGYDAVGIVIYNTSGTTPNLLSSYGTISNGNGTTQKLNNASVYDTSKGVGFEYQDYITVTKVLSPTTYDFNYMGKGYSAVMRFSSSFANWNGTARSFYAHTWNSTTINSLGFSTGSGFGMDVSWSSTENHFLSYSNMDTQF